MRRFILVLMSALALGGPPPSLADTASDEVISMATEELRQRDGREPTDAELIGFLNVVTVALDGKGKYALAERVARAALARGERVLGTEHPASLESLNNLASLYQSQGRVGEAEPLMRRVHNAALEAPSR